MQGCGFAVAGGMDVYAWLSQQELCRRCSDTELVQQDNKNLGTVLVHFGGSHLLNYQQRILS
jgi:hypothetical protein